MRARWAATTAFAVLVAGLTVVGPASAAPASNAGPGSGSGPAGPAEARVCGAPSPGHAVCGAVQLLYPGKDWHPGRAARYTGKPGGGGGGGTVVGLPSSGYYPGDLQSAYGLGAAAAAVGAGPSAPTVAVVDAYDDPNAASDLAAYRASLSGATDPNTGLTDLAIPPLCGGTTTTGCVTFTKVNQSGGTSYPRANSGWAEEISLDLDMISAVCPGCNIVLVEASSSGFSNLDAAVAYAQSLHPAAITNSYGGSEFSSETSYDGTYSAGVATAVTAASGDNGYGVEFPAASPGLTAVGGTSLSYSGTGSHLVWNPQTAWSSAGSGCSAFESLPAWQNDPGVYSLSSDCSARQVADVSAVADPSTGVAVYDTYNEPGWLVFGGTSVSAQIIGAVYGLAAGAGALQPAPSALYPDTTTGGAGPTPGLVPVTSGSNTSCGDYLCDAADSLSGGYNGPTGLGTPAGVGAFETASVTSGSLSLSPSAETLTAGTSAGPFTVDLSAPAPSGGLSVTLTTSSSTGGFSTSSTPSAAPSSPLTVTIGAGSTQSPSLYYYDTTAGTPAVNASATGWAGATLGVTVTAGPLASISVSPSSAQVPEGATQVFVASGNDAYGNPVSVNPTWTTTVSGSFSSTTGASTTFTAGTSTGSGQVTATVGGVSGAAAVTVTSLSAMSVTVTAGSVSKKGPNYHVPLMVAASNGSTTAPLDGASVTLQIFAGTACSGTAASTGSGTTATNGQVSFTFSTHQAGSWCALANVTASGYSPGSGTTTFQT